MVAGTSILPRKQEMFRNQHVCALWRVGSAAWRPQDRAYAPARFYVYNTRNDASFQLQQRLLLISVPAIFETEHMAYVTSSSFGNWIPSLLGGSCLGVASVVVLAQTGRVLGISGIVGYAATSASGMLAPRAP